jgi:hypothetical protein
VEPLGPVARHGPAGRSGYEWLRVADASNDVPPGDHETAGAVTEAAVGYLVELFGRRNGEGVRMAVRALRVAIPEAQVVTLAVNYIDRLMGALGEFP